VSWCRESPCSLRRCRKWCQQDCAQAGPAQPVQQLWEVPEGGTTAAALGGVGGGGLAKRSGFRVSHAEIQRGFPSGFPFPSVVASGSSMADGARGIGYVPRLRWLGKIMRNRDLVQLRTLGRVAVVLFALPMLVLTFGASAFAQILTGEAAPTPPPAPLQPSQQQLENWRKNMPAQPPRPGCFTSAYPSNQWQEVPCTTAPAVPFPPARGPRPDTVGNGRPYIRSGGIFRQCHGGD
jgi:hypothetical protein